MPRALIVTEPPVSPEQYRLGLVASGYSVIDEIEEPQRLIKRAVAIEPEIIVIASRSPSTELFQATRALADHAPHTVMLFTDDTASASIQSAAESGVHAYIADGFSAARLPVQIEVARARFRVMRDLRSALASSEAKLEERKLVDRAKGILMHSRHMSEDQAYTSLRKLAMEKKLKLAAIAEQVITASKLLV